MSSSSPPPGFEAITNPLVGSAIQAVNGRDRKLWFALFAEKTAFTDDGIEQDFKTWCDNELFGSSRAYLISIDKVEDDGLTFFARYHSDKWGDFKTFWRFKTVGGRFSKLDVGATSY
jgi:hypothetical protein